MAFDLGYRPERAPDRAGIVRCEDQDHDCVGRPPTPPPSDDAWRARIEEQIAWLKREVRRIDEAANQDRGG